MSRKSHTLAGFAFVLVCILLGIFLYIATQTSYADDRSVGDRSNLSSVNQMQVSASAAADKLDAEADRIDASTDQDGHPTDDPNSVNSSRSDRLLAASPKAGSHSDSVFGDGTSGILTCTFVGKESFTVQWETDDESGTVKINDLPVRGAVVGDWEPGPNKVRYDITIERDVKLKLPAISISDDGTMSDPEGHAGNCKDLQ